MTNSLAAGSCSFCELCAATSEVPRLYEDEYVIAIEPEVSQSEVHVLLISREHVESVDRLTEQQSELWWRLLRAAQLVARSQGIDVDEDGYSLITNAGRDETRAYPHLHVHVLNGAWEG